MKTKVALLAVMFLAGCSTTMTPFGTSSVLGIGGMAKYADPSQKVDPSQTAYKGAEGHAAALALGDIENPEARADAKEAMIAVSENTSIWGRGSRGMGTVGINGQLPIIAGSNGAFGRMYNPFEYPITVLVRGLGSPYTFGPGEEQELLVPPGKYDVVVYNAETRQLMGHNELNTAYRRKVGDKVYDFNIRLDAELAN